MRRGRLHLVEGEVTYSETKVKFGNESQIRKRKSNSETKQLFTCMNLCSGGATLGLVAEVTGLTGNTGTRSGSELKAEGQV